MGIGASKIAFDHRLDVELADLVPVAVAMNPHHTNAALPVSVLDQRHAGASSSAVNLRDFVTRYTTIMSNVRAIGRALLRKYDSLAQGLYCPGVAEPIRSVPRGLRP